jgi:general stress protein CsbA
MSKNSSVSVDQPSQIILSSREQLCLNIAWSVSGLSSAVAILAWGNLAHWQLSFQACLLFPLLGLLAFSLMWAHYVAGFVRTLMHVRKSVLSYYFKSTSMVVLALLFLHPGILILQRFRDGYGLPPQSYESYVAPGLGWVTLLGTVSWFAFIAFEFRRKFGDRSWWKYMLIAGDAAMLAIVYHGLRIGDHLQMGWYRGLWLGYGLVLAIILGYNYYQKYAVKQRPSTPAS